MNPKNTILLFFTLWALFCGIFAPTIDLFFTLLLIGFLIIIEIGSSFLKVEEIEKIAPIKYFLIVIFVFIVVNKIRTILVK